MGSSKRPYNVAIFTVLVLLCLSASGIGIKLLTQGTDLHHYGYARDSFLDCIWGISSVLLILSVLIIPAYVLSCHAPKVSFVLVFAWQGLAGLAVFVILVLAIILQFTSRSDYSCAYAEDGRNYSSNTDCIRKCGTRQVAVCCCCSEDSYGDGISFLYDTTDIGCRHFDVARRIEDEVQDLCWYGVLLLFIATIPGALLTCWSLCSCFKLGLWDMDEIMGSSRRATAKTEVIVTGLPIAQVVRQDDQTANIVTAPDYDGERAKDESDGMHLTIAKVAL